MSQPRPSFEHEPRAAPRAKSCIDVALAESYPLLLAGMEHLLAAHDDVRVVARCATAEHALRAVREYRPDILVSDLSLPDRSGLAVLRDIAQDLRPTRVILLAERIHENELLEAIRLGAKGVVLKQMPGELLVRCIRKVHAGGTWLENQSTFAAVEGLLQREAGNKEVQIVLTRRELEILRAVARGERTKDVATTMGITIGTAKIHLHNIYKKLDVSGRLELILFARERGWL